MKRKKQSFAFQWHITDSCDQRCKHCYIFSEGFCDFTSMLFKDMVDVLDSIEDMGIRTYREPYIYMTGGDPLLHPDFWKIAGEMHRRNIRFAIMGNPFHLDADVCTKLRQLGCRKYQVSLDGLEKTHDEFRMPGSFAETMRVIPLIREAGMYCAVMSTVSSKNMAEIPLVIDLVGSMNVDVFACGRYCPTSGQKRDEFHIEPLDYRKFLIECQKHIKQAAAQGSTTYFHPKDHLWTLLNWEQGTFKIPEDADPQTIYSGCHCAISHLTILPKGDVYACRRMESKVGNVFEKPLYELFMSAEMNEYRQYDQMEKCSTCELLRWCRGCSAVSYGYTKNHLAADPQCWKDL